MYRSEDNNHNKPTTMPMYPQQPDVDDPRWRDVAVRSRTQSQTDVKRFPIEKDGVEIATVYAGDTISIMPDVKFQYYVAARLGYHVGWINFKHVKLVSLHSRSRRYLEETKPYTHNEAQQTQQEGYIQRGYDETRPATRGNYHVQDEQYQEKIRRRTHYDDYVQQDYDETHPAEPRYQDERIELYKAQMQQRAHQEAHYEQQDYGVDDTQPAPPQAPRKPSPIARKDVNRIINKLKSLGGIFSRR